MTQSVSHWLLDEAPRSRRQAVLGSLYRGLLAIITNPPALAGLVIALGGRREVGGRAAAG